MDYPYDTILVLGNGVEPDGILSEQPRAGVEKAVQAYRNKQAPWVIMSGGLSYKADEAHTLSEAQAMKDYAISLGLPSEVILTEAESQDTLGNAYFTKTNLLEPLKLTSLLLIPGPHHSRERLDFIFGKVLGKGYGYDYLTLGKLDEEERRREQKSLQKLRELLDNVPDGDNAAMYAVLRLRHSGYAITNDKQDKTI